MISIVSLEHDLLSLNTLNGQYILFINIDRGNSPKSIITELHAVIILGSIDRMRRYI